MTARLITQIYLTNFTNVFRVYVIITVWLPLQKFKKMYPIEIVQPMKEELTENGFVELMTSSEVEEQLTKEGTTLVIINSVCGCSAGTARPGILMAVTNT